MVARFFCWETDPFHDVRHKVAYESWPPPFIEPCDAATATAQAWAARWSEDPDFPAHPIRDHDRGGHIVLPASQDQTPGEYLEANTKPEPEPAPAALYPFAGPANIVRTPSTDSRTIAAYERSRRGLKRLNAKPPVPAYEAPTPRIKGHNPTLPRDPDIAPRFYEPDRSHPKYRRPGER